MNSVDTGDIKNKFQNTWDLENKECIRLTKLGTQRQKVVKLFLPKAVKCLYK